MLLTLVCVGQFMVVLDVSIVNVALPSIQKDLGFSSSGLQWVVNAYTLTFAGFMLLGGRAADIFGRRRIFIAGLAIFTVSSLIGGILAESGDADRRPRPARVRRGHPRPGHLDDHHRDLHRAGGPGSCARGMERGRVGRRVGRRALLGGDPRRFLNWRWILFVNVPIGLAALVFARAASFPSRGRTSSTVNSTWPGR